MTTAATERDDGPARGGFAECIERPPTGRRIVHDDRGERFAQRRFDGRAPIVVDLHQVEERAEHAVDADQAFGAGPRPSGVECQLQGVDPSRRPGRGVRVVGSQRAPRVGECLGRGPRRLGGFDFGDQRFLDTAGRVALATEPVGRLVQGGDPLGERVRTPLVTADLVEQAVQAGADRPQLATDLGRRARRGEPAPSVGATAASAVLRSLSKRRSSISSSSISGRTATMSAATISSSSRNRTASASRLATRSASSSWPGSRSSDRRRSASTAASPRARSRNCSTRASRSPVSLCPRADSSASIAITEVSSPASDDFSSLSAVALSRRVVDSDSSRTRQAAISRPATNVFSAVSSVISDPCRSAAAAWRSSGRSWRRTSRSRSCTRSRLASVASSRRSAFSLRRRNFRTPAASSMIARAVLGARVQHGVDLALADDHVLLTADAGIGRAVPARRADGTGRR